jgi:itaconate CoA-transferase
MDEPGKGSVVLDLKDDDDLALLHGILGIADVFVQNLAPGAAARLGLDSTDLRVRYPRLVTCDITGYGERPCRHMKAYDFLMQCEGGLVSVPGAPGRIGVSICDIGAGMNAAQGVIAALLHRERTGKATGISVSLFDTAANWMSVPLVPWSTAERRLLRSACSTRRSRPTAHTPPSTAATSSPHSRMTVNGPGCVRSSSVEVT